MADTSKPGEFPTVIGSDAKFKGELTFEGSVRIDGQFEGGINTPGTVYVSKGGKVKAEVSAGSVSVDGDITGNVSSQGRVELNTTCKLQGDLKAEKLLVKEGATFVGHCQVGPGAGKLKQAGGDGAMKQVQAAAQGRK